MSTTSNHVAYSVDASKPDRNGRRTIILRHGDKVLVRDLFNPDEHWRLGKFCEAAVRAIGPVGIVDFIEYDPEGSNVPDMRWLSQRVIDAADRADAGEEISFPIFSSGQLDAAEFAEDWIIENFLVARQPMILAAPPKTMKTVLLIVLALSLAMGKDFLGKFAIRRAVRVLFFSAESGLSTMRKTARAVATSMGFELADVGNLLWCEKAPRLAHPLHLDAIRQEIRGNEIEVAIFDPAYLMLGTGGNENSLFAMGELLAPINALCQEENATMILAHHTKKAGGEPGQPLELSSIAWSGFEQFARQWVLLSRREPYQGDQPGLHKLWLNYGGSAGHSGLYGLDIDEGPHHSRRWNVDVLAARDIRDEKAGEKDRERADKAEAQIERDRKALVQAAAKYPDGETLKVLRTRAGFGGTRSELALKAALDAGDLVPIDIIKPPRKTPWQGYKLAPEKDSA